MKTKEIALKDIKPGPFHYRDDLDRLSVGDLAKSIKTEGMINPLTVRTNGKGYELVCGHRRFLALKHLKREMADCRVIEATDREARKMAIAENFAREDLCPLEKTEAVAEWVDAYLDEHCEGYPAFLRDLREQAMKEKGPGRHIKHTPDFSKAKSRVNFLLTLMESDRRAGTKVISDSVIGNCTEAFATLPKAVKPESYARNDLPFVMDLDDSPEVKEAGKKYKLPKACVKAMLKLKHDGANEPKLLERLKAILKSGEVDDLTDWNEPNGKKLKLGTPKVKSRHIYPPKPKNRGRVREIKPGEKPKEGLSIAERALQILRGMALTDLQFDAAIKTVRDELGQLEQQHKLLVTDEPTQKKGEKA